jgi:hypothetical protein
MGEWRYNSTILNFVTIYELVVSFTLCHFTHREFVHRAHWIGGWVDPRAGLGVMEKRKYVDPTWN